MKAKSSRKSLRKKESSGTMIYVILVLLLVLASISWIQNNTRPKNYAEEVTPLLQCGTPCTYNSQCPTGLFCYNSACRNPQCKDTADCTCVVTPTINPNSPTNTPYPTASGPTATPKPSPTPSTKPTVTPSSSTISPTSGVIVIISPEPTADINPSVTPTPAVFEVDKENPKKVSILEAILNFVADLFCKLFKC